MASVKTRIGNVDLYSSLKIVSRSASLQTPFHLLVIFPRTWKSAAIWIPVIDFVQIAHARHSTSKLGSALAQSQFSRRLWAMSFELLLNFYITKDDTTELMVILNSFQDLSAEKDKKRLAVRCWNEFSITFGVICYLYSHFGEANSILMFFCHKTHNSSLTTHGSKLNMPHGICLLPCHRA